MKQWGWSFAFILLIESISGCGPHSGRSDSGSTGPVGPPLHAEYNVLQGHLLDSAGAPLVGANVLLSIGSSSKNSVTGNYGVFRVELSSVEYAALPPFFSLIATKTGFVAKSLEFRRSAESSSNGEDFAPADVTLESSVTAERVTIQALAAVRHLGDSNYNGSANSGFQIPLAEGTSLDAVFNLTVEDLTNAANAKIEITVRGAEDTDLLFTNADGEVAASSTISELANSPADGSSGTQFIEIPLTGLAAGANRFTITSVFEEGIYNWDDFEITVVNIHIFKNPDTCSQPLQTNSVRTSAIFCAPQFDRNARQVACMAARTADTNGIRAEDYSRASWTKRDFFNYAAESNFCFVLARRTSPAGVRPLTYDANFPDEDDCRSRYTQLYDWAVAQSMGTVTPLRLFKRAMDVFANDAVFSLAAIAELSTWHAFAVTRGVLIREAEFASESLTFTEAYARACAAAPGVCTGNVAADKLALRNEILLQMDREYDVVTRNFIPITSVLTDGGQYYHYWGYFTLNYIFPAPQRLLTNIGGFLWEAGPLKKILIGGDFEFDGQDLQVDQSGRASGQLFECLVEDLRSITPPTAATWWDELGCDAQLDPARYPSGFTTNRKFLPARVGLLSLSPACTGKYIVQGLLK